jgi:uncharacterized damage-inducible protein DinB
MSPARKLGISLAPLLLAGLAATAGSPRHASAADPTATTPPPGVRGEILGWIEDAEKKLTELANATPEARYAWRPTKDARSTGEVFMHVVTANYHLSGMAGATPPAGVDLKSYEKSLTKKAEIDKALADSFAHVKKALIAASDADMDKPADLFGRKTTVRGVYLLVLSHAHEHLGQSIAYARMGNIVPPWTARNKAKADAQKQAAAAKKPAAP